MRDADRPPIDPQRRRVLISAAAALAGLAAGPSRAQAVRPDPLLEAIQQAAPGTTLRLPGGLYGELRITRDDPDFGGVTLASADPADPAVLTALDLRGVGGLAFEGIRFDYRFRVGTPIHQRPFSLSDCRDIALRHCLFDGDEAQGVSAEEDGYGWGIGFSASRCRRLQFEGNEIRRFHRGMTLGHGDEIEVRGNNFHDLRMDGLNLVGMQGILIEDNHFHDFRRAPGTRDHADMIQLWSRNADRPSTGIAIRGNVLMQGEGGSSQSIFMRNEEVDTGRAGREMFYRDVAIEENVIVNGHAHGITVGATIRLAIRNNTLLRHRDAAVGPDRTRRVRMPRISVSEASEDVTITGNIAEAVPEPRPGWQVADNLLVQDVSPSRPGYYQRLFAAPFDGDPSDIESYIYRSELLATAGNGTIGARLLRPDVSRQRFR